MQKLRLFLVLLFCFVFVFLDAQDNDCATTSIEICSNSSINVTPNGPGINDFLPPGNDDGCLSGEHFSTWIIFSFNSLTPPGSLIEFTITPTSFADYDFAIYGPNYDCNNLGSPVACSYAAGNSITGLGMGATDTSEDAGGDGFVAPITVNPNETFIMIVDNFSSNGVAFDLTWGGSAAPFLQCCPLSVDVGPDLTVCEGDSPFSLNGTISGDNGPVTYLWTATNGGDAYLSDLTSSTPVVSIPSGVTGTFVYTLTATDSGCSVSSSMMVTVNSSPTININTTATGVCPGDMVTLTANGTFASYSWSTGDVSQSISVSTAGTYSLTVTDTNGCTGTSSITIVGFPSPIVNIMGNPVICSGGSTTLDAGVGFVDYSWNTGENTQQINILTPGNYSVTVTDGNGCLGVGAINITLQEDLMPTISGNLSFCQGGSTTLDAGGSYSSYQWSTGETTQDIMVDAAGIYSVTITDGSGCSGNSSVDVSVLPNPTPIITGNTSFCPGGSTVLDAGPGYTDYQWSTGQSGQSITLTTAGLISVIVTDANGCTGTSMVNVTQSPPFTVSISGPTDICANETATLTADPGFTSYSWSTLGSGQSISVNGAGTYSVTATDANGCTAQASITINQSPDLTPTITGDLAFCSGSNTTLDAGSGYATYNWSDGQSSQVISVSSPGTISVTVSDVVGCSGTASVNLTENTPPVPSITGVLAFCAGQSTTLDAGPGYQSYQWSTGQTDQSITVINGGAYEVTVTDFNNCTGVSSVFVTENPLPVPNITGVLAFCAGQSTTIDAGPGYQSYQWSSGQTDQSITVINGGAYEVTVTDFNNCTGVSSVFVTENPLPVPNITGVLAFCAGQSTTIDAGLGYQSYQWSTGEFTQNITVATQGNYEVTVTDFNGCQGSTQTQVTELPPVFVQIDGDSELCQGQDGLLDAGDGYQTYEWSTGEFGQLLFISNPGLYSVTVTDANGCQGTSSTFITLSSSPDATISGDLELCLGTPTTLTATSGPYFYQWSTDEVTQSIQVDQPGTYSVIITNNAGCFATAEVTVTTQSDPTPIIFGDLSFCDGGSSTLDAGAGFATYLWSDGSDTQTIDVYATGDYSVTVTTFDGCTGEGMVSVIENTLPSVDIQGNNNICEGTVTTLDAGAGFATYLWSDGSGASTLDVSITGTYSVTVTDVNGCEATDQFVLDVSPNPEPQISGSLSFCPGGSTTLDGGSFFSYFWSTGETASTIIVDTPNTYSLTVTDDNGCQGETTVQVEEQTELSPIISGDLAYCAGGSTTLDVGAGFSIYAWSTGENTQEIEASTPGDYTVTVSDGGGCSGEVTVSVTQNDLPVISIAGLSSICEGEISTLDPGSGFSSYAWSDGSNNPTLDVSTTGGYSVTVTDTNGCAGIGDFALSVNPLPQPSIVGATAFCEDLSTTLSSDQTYDTYTWSTGQDMQEITVSDPGVISLMVIDSNGCEGSSIVILDALPIPTVSISGDNIFCTGSTTTLDAGTGFTHYLWSDSSSAQQLDISIPGNYAVEVTDDNGCTATASIDITENVLPTISISGDDSFCAGGMASLDAGAGFNSYAWSDGSIGQILDVTQGGTYSVEVTDANNCSNTAQFVVTENTLPQPQIAGSLSFCPGSVTILDGGSDYVNYVWTGGTTNQTVEVNTAGIYELTVIDTNGCIGNTSVEVIEDADLSPVIAGDLSFCVGSTTTLDAGTGFDTYTWSDNSTDQILVVNQTGDYSVTVTNGGCSGEITVSVSEDALPIPTINGLSMICEDATTTINVNETFISYLWSDGTNNASIDVPPGVYGVQVEDINGCIGEATFDVSPISLPVPSLSGVTAICGGGATVISTLENYVDFVWSTGSVTATTLVTNPGVLSVTVTDSDGCVGSNSIEIGELEDIELSILGDLFFCEGESTIIEGEMGYASYEWSNGQISQNLQVSQAGEYTLSVMDTTGCSGEITVSVIEHPLPQPIINGDSGFCEGAEASVSVQDIFTAYTWSNGDIQASTTTNQGGILSVLVTDANGCSAEASIEITENPLPEADAGDIQTINCENTSVIIGAPNTPQGNYTYTWTGPGIDSSNQNDYQPTVDSGGVYTLVVEDLDSGCISESAQVEIEDLRYEPIVLLEVLDVLDCETLSVLINSDGSTYGSDIIYQWQDATGTIMSSDQNYIATQEGIVILMIIDEVTGCMALDSVTIEQNEDYPIVIAGDDQEIDCDTPDAILDGSASQSSPNIIYEWTAQSGGNIISDNTQPIITVDAVGTYTLIAVDTTNGCTNEDIVEVLGDFDPPIAEAGMNQTLDCNNLSVLLEGNGSSIGTNISYQWQNTSGETVGEDISFNADMIGVYQLIVTDNQNGCVAEDNVEVFQVEDELSAYDLSWDGPTCFGDDDASLSIFNIEGGDGPYLYSINDGVFSSNPDFTGLTAGTYAVVVQDANGCELLSEVVIEDGNDLQVYLGEDINISLGEVVTIDGNVTVDIGNLAEIIWKVTGDTLGCDECIVFDASPMLTSEYILTVVDSNGCVATDDLTIFVDARDDIFIPNAFSPDDDGNNERFTIYTGDDVAKIRSFLVFNRWGEVMHEVYNFPPNDQDFGWNGEYRGQLQNTGVFVYMAEIEFIDGTVKLYKGDVLLMK